MRAFAKNDIHTIGELKRLLSEGGETHIKSCMFGIGAVTAEEVLQFLGECWARTRVCSDEFF